ncbi:MAG: CoA pyrophosphatase [Bacteroidales bacterium]|nr:CoA pyrophosphatase [Bacteroidales bacterium]
MQESINPERWKETLATNLPGEQAQLLMASEFRGAFTHEGEPVHAAVMVLMYPSDGHISLAFIKRNEYPGPHSAQVSFPGGAREDQDGSLEFTALRETREELGINDGIGVLGSLTELYIPVSNFMVTPFVGWLDQRPVFNPDTSEVQYVIEASVYELMDPKNQRSETILQHGQTLEVPIYVAGDEKIWGATAMMLSEFLEVASMLL